MLRRAIGRCFEWLTLGSKCCSLVGPRIASFSFRNHLVAFLNVATVLFTAIPTVWLKANEFGSERWLVLDVDDYYRYLLSPLGPFQKSWAGLRIRTAELHWSGASLAEDENRPCIDNEGV